MERAATEIYRQLKLIGVGDYNVVISTNVELRRDGLPYSNQKNPHDPGSAVYFMLKGQPKVLACDKWDRVEHNLWSIAMHIDAIRAQDRYGVGTVEQAFAGYTALPPPADLRPWYEVLGVSESCTLEEARAAWIKGAKLCHPDNGGSDAAMAAINGAWKLAQEVRQ
jgi:hypothetical protein